MDTARQDWINDARALIDWLEQHPDRIPTSDNIRLDLWYLERAELQSLARDFGQATKEIVGTVFCLRKSFGPHRIDGNVPREEVCRKIVTGTVEHEERIAPAYTEEIVEWECDESLLRDSLPRLHSIRVSDQEALAIANQHEIQRDLKW